MTAASDIARQACETLAYAYGHHADAGEADKLAELFTTDGVFNRLGTRIVGREAIRDFIANRPTHIWQTHRASNFTFELVGDGRSATGTLDLVLERGQLGDTRISETVHARYHDQFVLSEAGWKFKIREVQIVEPPV